MQHYLNFYGLLFGAWFLCYIIYTIYWYTQYVQLAIKSGYLYSLLIFYWLMFNIWSKQMSNLITLVHYEDHNPFFGCSWLIDITSVRGISYSYLSRKTNKFYLLNMLSVTNEYSLTLLLFCKCFILPSIFVIACVFCE